LQNRKKGESTGFCSGSVIKKYAPKAAMDLDPKL
jgi:hypothetical protein